ncbi:MAG: DUF805 domain-containing protein [Candidatus Aureabacteria bacterium]|nr:DUF805 domain-containing protein [Candidatus Auribacterota bacterium]
MKELFTTEGRVGRATLWKYYILLIAGIAVFVLLAAVFQLQNQAAIMLLLLILLFPLCVIGLFVQIKRWHDRDKSGWWILINLVPYIGGLWSFIELGFIKGTDGDNRFGPDPLQKN